MRLQDLDEWQGLTEEIVRAHLERTGWLPFHGATWRHGPTGARSTISFLAGHLDATINGLARHSDRTPQAILREICPRWHRGLPSIDEIRSHDSANGSDLWLFRSHEGTPEITQAQHLRTKQDLASGPIDVWPCDLNGSRCSWPTPTAST